MQVKKYQFHLSRNSQQNLLLTAPLSSLKDMGYPIDSSKGKLFKFSKLILGRDDLEDGIQLIINDDIESDSESSVINDEDDEKSITVTSENNQILQKFLQDVMKACYSNSGVIANNQASIDEIIKACRSNIKGDVNGQMNIKILNESQTNYCKIISGIIF